MRRREGGGRERERESERWGRGKGASEISNSTDKFLFDNTTITLVTNSHTLPFLH